MNSFIGICGVVALLLIVGTGLGLLDRKAFSFRWLLIAAGLVLLNDFMLTSGYGLVPDLIGGDWNWQGKFLALAASLVVASLAAFGWRQCGLTLVQNRKGIAVSMAVALALFAVYTFMALAQPNEPGTFETTAFQMTMPGLEEELFYTGIMLFTLNKAFTARLRFLGADWGWSVPLTAALFGLAHAFGFSSEGFSFDWLTMILVSWPAAIIFWLRMRTGSILIPILLHNYVNSVGHFI